MHASFNKFVKLMSSLVWRVLSGVLPRKERSVSVCTFPDYDDTLRALQVAAAEMHFRIEVLVGDTQTKKPSWFDPSVCSVHRKKSLSGIVAFHRSSFALFTHGLYSSFPLIVDRPVLNLWHGMPVKRIGRLDSYSTSRLPRSHWLIADNEMFRPIMAEAFQMDSSKVILMEHPRLDIMMSPPQFQKWWDDAEDQLIVWLPTYRKSAKGELRRDGGNTPFGSEPDLHRLDALLSEHGARLIIKLHPMEAMHLDDLPRFRKIEIVSDEALANHGASLYQLLGNASALITDISSVLFDFRRLGRPIYIYFPDQDAYEASRGFVAPLDQLVQEPIIGHFQQLVDQLEAFLSKVKPAHAPKPVPDANRAAKVLQFLLKRKWGKNDTH